MKYTLFATSLIVFTLFGAGCKNEQAAPPTLPPAVQELQVQQIPSSTKLEARAPAVQPVVEKSTALYKGSWFDITYPKSFTAAPQAPTTTTNGITVVQTDEATFTSPDGKVEFFVYSPLWAGQPKSYLELAPTEELLDEKLEEDAHGEGTYDDTMTHWATIKAFDGSYYRSFVSTRTESTHLVFGIKYRDAASYQTYKADYVAFKQSLTQYAD